MNIAFVKKHLDKNRNWSVLSANKSITLKMIQENSDLPWDHESLSNNNNLTLEYVLDNLNLIHFYNLSNCQFNK